jgi:uncharacterized protein (UPF0335 family)
VRVTIHQPEHFPYMGFFQKLSVADVYVVLDNVKYKKNYFQNRNKIPNLLGADEWVTVPVEKKATSKKIKDVMTSADTRWRKKLLRKIQQNLKFDASEIYSYEKLIDINMASIRWGLKKRGVDVDIIFASDIGVSGTKSELLANICNKLNATKYISGPFGRKYLDRSYFKNIEIEFFEPKVSNYYSCLYNLTKEIS